MTGPAASSDRRTETWVDAPRRLALPPDEVHVLAFGLDVSASRLHALTAVLSPDEQERARRFAHERHRRRYIVRRARIRTILGRYLDREPVQLRFHYGPHGKPALEGATSGLPLRFNASHAHELGVLAIQLDDEVGIDLEHLRPFPQALSIARRFFAPDEYRGIRAAGSDAGVVEFFRCWTRKEAVVKALGLGLSHRLNTVRFAGQPGTALERVVGIEPVGAGARPRWSLPVPPPASDYTAALVIEGGPRRPRYWRWTDAGDRTAAS